MAVSTAIDASAVARALGIKTDFVDLRGGLLFLPQRVVVIGQGSDNAVYSTDKQRVLSLTEAGNLYGFGSPVHLALRELLPSNGDGVGAIPVTIYPLQKAGGAVAASGAITPVGAVTKQIAATVVVNGVRSTRFVIPVGASVASIVALATAAINANLDMPVIATDSATKVDLVSKWSGASSNDISVSMDLSDNTSGVTFGLTQPSGGLVNPDVTVALNQVGNVWETMFLNCFNVSDTTILDEYSTFGEGRWGALVRKPMMVYSGSNEASVLTASALGESRPLDRTNIQINAPGCANLPFVIAARALARIAKTANNNPPQDYGSLEVTGLIPGTDAEQWDYIQRDTAVKRGASTSEVRDGVVVLQDVITFYHPAGEPIPGYRYAVDLVKLQNAIFNMTLIFETDEWDGAPLIPDDQPTVNPTAKKPRMAVAAIARLIDNLGLNAIISDPETAKSTIQAEIDAANPKRLNVAFTIQLSGNTNIISIDFNFGFYFGTQTVVA